MRQNNNSPVTSRECDATTIRGSDGEDLDSAVTKSLELPEKSTVIETPSEGFWCPLRTTTVSPHFPFPALAAVKLVRNSGLALLSGEGGVRGRVKSRMELSAHAAANTSFCFRGSRTCHVGPSAFRTGAGRIARWRTSVPKTRSNVCKIAGYGFDGSSSSFSSSNSGLSSKAFVCSPSSSESSDMTAFPAPFARLRAEGTSCCCLNGLPPLQTILTPFSWA